MGEFYNILESNEALNHRLLLTEARVAFKDINIHSPKWLWIKSRLDSMEDMGESLVKML